MKQGHDAVNNVDEDGNPTGGWAETKGANITWQKGPLGRDGERIEPNGAFVEDIIAMVIQRIEFYQTASEGKFRCRENAVAITKLEEAGMWLDKRTRDREARQVEGTHQA